MEICLVRHAIAVERGTPGYEDDGKRPLTPKGHEKMEEAAAGLATLVTPQVVISSPLVRAWQTAEILVLQYRLPPPRPLEALASGDDEALVRALQEMEGGTVMLVGHEPHISRTLSFLLTGDPDAVAALFKKGAAALLSCPGEAHPGECALEWLLQPAALRRLAHSPG